MEQTSFTDSDGVLWNVREDGADESRSLSADVAPGTTWLRFESELEVRRLWHYPDDWRGLSPLQMESLLDRASTVIARFRPAPHHPVNVDTPLNPPKKPTPELRVAPKPPDLPPSDPLSRGEKKSG